MKYIQYLLLPISFSCLPFLAFGQTFELKFEEIPSHDTVSQYVVVDIYMAFSSSGKLGSSNLQFTFPETVLSNPILVSHSLTTTLGLYTVHISEPVANKVSLNIDLNNETFGDTISTTWVNLAQIKFEVIDLTQLASLLWSYNGGSTETVVFLDDNNTQIYSTSSNDLQNINDINSPIQLCCFNANLTPTQEVNLTWKMLPNLNNSHFNIEHSTDEEIFTKIGKIERYDTTSTLEEEYKFTHTKPKQGKNYYRLQQVDFDGKFNYSTIVSVELADSPVYPVSIYPNPVKDVLNIDFGDYTIEQSIKILDSQGKIIQLLDISNNQIRVVDLPKGVYVLVIDDWIHLKWVKI